MSGPSLPSDFFNPPAWEDGTGPLRVLAYAPHRPGLTVKDTPAYEFIRDRVGGPWWPTRVIFPKP